MNKLKLFSGINVGNDLLSGVCLSATLTRILEMYCESLTTKNITKKHHLLSRGETFVFMNIF